MGPSVSIVLWKGRTTMDQNLASQDIFYAIWTMSSHWSLAYLECLPQEAAHHCQHNTYTPASLCSPSPWLPLPQVSITCLDHPGPKGASNMMSLMLVEGHGLRILVLRSASPSCHRLSEVLRSPAFRSIQGSGLRAFWPHHTSAAWSMVPQAPTHLPLDSTIDIRLQSLYQLSVQLSTPLSSCGSTFLLRAFHTATADTSILSP